MVKNPYYAIKVDDKAGSDLNDGEQQNAASYILNIETDKICNYFIDETKKKIIKKRSLERY